MSIEDICARTWDLVIVGGGSAGCVLANRLSADPARHVLLIEAGRDLPPGEEPLAIRDTYPVAAAFDRKNHWPRIDAYIQPVSHNALERPALRHYEQARILGGGSSINGQVANRGTPDDYDEWAALGAEGWGWHSVLPSFKRIETDLDFSGPMHGRDGPLSIWRVPRRDWPGVSLAAEKAISNAGFRDLEDQNGCFEDGYFPQSLTNNGRQRVSAAMAFLDVQTRRRPNLCILTGTEVTALRQQLGVVTGVCVRKSGAPENHPSEIAAYEVIVSSGAIHSPTLLMRSGIGPADALNSLDIPVVADLPGVGRNLMEHPGISVSCFVARQARRSGTRRHGQVALRYSSGLGGCPRSDMYLMVMSRSAWHPLGSRIASFVAWINKPFARGRVALQSPHVDTPPLASFEMLADVRDASRLAAAVRLMARLLGDQALRGIITHPSPSSYSGFAKKLGIKTLGNLLLTAPVAACLDAVPPLRDPFFRTFVGAGRSLDELIQDDDALDAYVRERVFGQWHASGTCRMGPASDRDCVVNPKTARVHGVGGLRVVDASVMPTVPRANTNLPTMMIADHFAAAVGAERQNGSA